MTFRIAKALALTLAATTYLSALPAEAGGRGHKNGNYHYRPAPEAHHVDGGGILAAAILGLAAGAIIAGMTEQARPQIERVPIYREPAWRHPQAYPRPSPDRHYFPPAPLYQPAPGDFRR